MGSALHSTGTSDFSALLHQAQRSGADALTLAKSGTDHTHTLKQQAEFGLTHGSLKVAGLGMCSTEVHAQGVEVARNTHYATAFYWDVNPQAAEWSKVLSGAGGSDAHNAAGRRVRRRRRSRHKRRSAVMAKNARAY